MMILAIDPGTKHSAYVVIDTAGKIHAHAILPNAEMLDVLYTIEGHGWQVVCEWIASYGMAVGYETFQTCYWVGRFAEATSVNVHVDTWARMYRAEVKLHLCGSMKATDANIWRAILDRYGGDGAVGVKKKPGPLYGVRSHERAALAVALTYADGVRSKIKGEE